jgi:hypothetical protein
MRLVFPNAQRINRGGYIMSEICNACRANDVTDLVILVSCILKGSNILNPYLIAVSTNIGVNQVGSFSNLKTIIFNNTEIH